MSAFAFEHSRVIAQGLQILNHEFPEIRMRGIDQAVVLIGRQDRGNGQEAMLASLSKVVTDAGKLGRRSRIAPVCGELRNLDPLRLHLGGDLRHGKHEVFRRVIFIEMNKVFEQGQRLVL